MAAASFVEQAVGDLADQHQPGTSSTTNGNSSVDTTTRSCSERRQIFPKGGRSVRLPV